MRRVIYLLIAVQLLIVYEAGARRIHCRLYGYSLTVPSTMTRVTNPAGDIIYEDRVAGVLLLISARDGRFRSVNDYMNCGIDTLERKLTKDFGDASFKLLRCARSAYYADEANVLSFRAHIPPSHYDDHLIYFIHHHSKDIQIWFSYNSAKEAAATEYTDQIMQTLRLR